MPDPITVPTTIRIRSRRPSTRASARSDKERLRYHFDDEPPSTAVRVCTAGSPRRAARPQRSDLARATGPAPARNRALADDRVVVGELFAFADVPAGANPDRLVHHLEPAVRRARVVDEPCDVAADVRVAA